MGEVEATAGGGRVTFLEECDHWQFLHSPMDDFMAMHVRERVLGLSGLKNINYQITNHERRT